MGDLLAQSAQGSTWRADSSHTCNVYRSLLELVEVGDKFDPKNGKVDLEVELHAQATSPTRKS